jgi:hypothetical protein
VGRYGRNLALEQKPSTMALHRGRVVLQ